MEGSYESLVNELEYKAAVNYILTKYPHVELPSDRRASAVYKAALEYLLTKHQLELTRAVIAEILRVISDEDITQTEFEEFEAVLIKDIKE